MSDLIVGTRPGAGPRRALPSGTMRSRSSAIEASPAPTTCRASSADRVRLIRRSRLLLGLLRDRTSSTPCTAVGGLRTYLVEGVDGVIDGQLAEAGEAGVAGHRLGLRRREAERAEPGSTGR